jgi:hypothetical protein
LASPSIVIAEVFRSLDFEVMENSKTARPRQTDLTVRWGDEGNFIEVKWEFRKSGVPEKWTFTICSNVHNVYVEPTAPS